MVKKLLILGGTAEAADLARKAHQTLEGKVEIITSLAGRLEPRPGIPGQDVPHSDVPGRVRVGGFGGSGGLTDYLKSESIDLVVDATHPFAETISAGAYDACLAAETPRLSLIRPPWPFPPLAKWVEVDDLGAAAEVLPRMSRRTFLTIGRSGLGAFSKVGGVWFLVRLMQKPDGPLPLSGHQLITGRPPFSVESERALIRDHQIDVLVTKQSGGKAGEAKITAALEANIKIIAIKRPPSEPGERVETVEEALAWIAKNL